MKEHPFLSPSYKLDRQKRLRKRQDFLKVQKRGARSFGKCLVVIARDSFDHPNGRVGITVPKKVGKAHDRNTIKRRIKHILRINPLLFSQKDIVVIAKENCPTVSFDELKSELIFLLGKIKQKAAFKLKSPKEGINLDLTIPQV